MAKARKAKPRGDDPAAGAERSHPVGVGVGAAGGAATGAAIGAAGGPAGAVIGAAVGGIAGGLAGKAAAQALNPKEEEDYWREHFRARPYAAEDADYSSYAPAYRYGWEATAQYQGRSFDDVEPELSRGWDEARGESTIEWDRARNASRDAWDRVQARGTRVDEDDAGRFASEAGERYRGRAFDEVEPDLRQEWESRHAGSSSWERVREAVREAWQRVERALPGDADRERR